jgi:hypothetical protein
MENLDNACGAGFSGGRMPFMATSPKWQFKAKFRANAYGWQGSKLAITRLKEAVKEIRTIARADPVAAGDGCVSLMERLWPAFQHIDTSSGALGNAIHKALEELIPLLIAAPVDKDTRAIWLERLFEAVQEDGVDYLDPVAECWGEIARDQDLVNRYADMLLGRMREAWADRQRYNHVVGSKICLSCLLEAGRYQELRELLALHSFRFWSFDRFAAEALLRQGLWQEAIAHAEASRSKTNGAFSDHEIDRYCENVLIQQGHPDEAYGRYGLASAFGTTNLATYRALAKKYPQRDPRQMLIDLIETRGDKGKWFAAAKDAGFLDIAISCAAAPDADPSTLVRAARDFADKQPEFAIAVGVLAIKSLLSGGGYEPLLTDAANAVRHIKTAAASIGFMDWAVQQIGLALQQPCVTGREIFRDSATAELRRQEAQAQK